MIYSLALAFHEHFQNLQKFVRYFAATIVLTFCSSVCFGQYSTISGRIVDTDSIPLKNVTVGIPELKKTVGTNARGHFVIKNVPTGVYHLKLTSIGMETRQLSFTVKESNLIIPSIVMVEKTSLLDSVLIRSNLNSINISSSLRLKSPLIEIPQNIQVVSSQTLQDQQITTNDGTFIRNVSGLYKENGYVNLYTRLFARGMRVNAYRNGFNVENSYWGPLSEDMSVTERVEFIKGPASFLPASGNHSGLYNVVTKKPTGESQGSYTLMLGSFNFYRSSLDLDGKLTKDGRLLFRLNIAGQKAGSFRANEFADRYIVAPVISYQIGPASKITAEYHHQRAQLSDLGSDESASPTGFATLPRNFTMLPAGIPPTKIKDQSLYLTFNHQFNDNWELTAQTAHFYFDQVGTFLTPIPKMTPEGRIKRKIMPWDFRTKMDMGQVFVNGTVKTKNIRQHILAGLDMTNKIGYDAYTPPGHLMDPGTSAFDVFDPDLSITPSQYPDFSELRETSVELRGSQRREATSYSSIFLQDEFRFFDRFSLTLAGRYTWLNDVEGGSPIGARTFTPRVGLSVSIDKSFSIFALYDQSFNPQHDDSKSGAIVKPRVSTIHELGAKKNWFGGKFNTSISIYKIEQNGSTGLDVTKPESKARIDLMKYRYQGIEFDASGEVAKGLTVIANYAYTDTKIAWIHPSVKSIDAPGFRLNDPIKGVAKHVANTWISYKLDSGTLNGLAFSSGATFVGGRMPFNTMGGEVAEGMDDYLKVDGGISWENNKLKIIANVFNVLDKYLYNNANYHFALKAYTWRTEAPRNYRLSLIYKF